MLKQYNIRLNITDIDALSKLGGCRSEHIRTAIRGYLQSDMNLHNGYNQELVNVLKDQVTDLKQDKQTLQKRLDYFMLPWYHRLLLKQP